MRMLYLALGMALLSFTLLYSGASSNGSTNITAAINSTRQYIDRVNQSAYLVFYPNLNYAYNALNEAVNVSHTNATEAYSLLQLASSSAAAAQRHIYQYSLASIYALAVISAALAAMLFYLMRKPKKSR